MGRFSEVRSSGQVQKCNGCGALTDKWELDHIHPRSRGGTNDPENFQILCVECNRGKRGKFAFSMREWVLVPNARCRSFWAGREHLAPLGKTTMSPYSLRPLPIMADIAAIVYDQAENKDEVVYLFSFMTEADQKQRGDEINQRTARLFAIDGKFDRFAVDKALRKPTHAMLSRFPLP